MNEKKVQAENFAGSICELIRQGEKFDGGTPEHEIDDRFIVWGTRTLNVDGEHGQVNPMVSHSLKQFYEQFAEKIKPLFDNDINATPGTFFRSPFGTPDSYYGADNISIKMTVTGDSFQFNDAYAAANYTRRQRARYFIRKFISRSLERIRKGLRFNG